MGSFWYNRFMSKIGITEVERLAKLARIELTPTEAESLTIELEQIREFVGQLGEVDLGSTLPTDQVTGLQNVTRSDVVQASDQTRQQLLANAPSQQDGFIKVHRTLHG